MDLTDLKYNITHSYFKINEDEFKVLAHSNELLDEHISKTKLIFDRIVNTELLCDFYNYFYQQKYIDVDYENFLKYLYKMVDFHDIAKISFNFQVNRLKNAYVTEILQKHGLDNIIGSIESKHSYISSLLYVSHLLNEKIDFERNKLLLLFSYVIYGHHTSLKDIL
ncbi:MAG: hypothetical protein PQ975_06805 [Methanobacterium sp.]|jgi:CRISPR-associated endonuclease/helicase Cas3